MEQDIIEFENQDPDDSADEEMEVEMETFWLN